MYSIILCVYDDDVVAAKGEKGFCGLVSRGNNNNN